MTDTETTITPAPHLTAAEHDAVQLLAAGCEMAEIAERLGRSYHTIKTELARAMDRLGARNGTQLVALSLAHGLIPTDAYAYLGRDR